MGRCNTGIIVCLLFIIGCAVTKVTSFKDPSFTGKHFHRILVGATIVDIEERTLVEQSISTQLAEHGITGIPSISIILPIRTYTVDEVTKLLAANDIHGVRFLKLTGKEKEIATSSGQQLNIFTGQWETVTSIYSLPKMYFGIQLYDVASDKLIWVASTRTSGNAYANLHVMVDSLAATVIKKLQDDGLLE